MKRLKFNPDLGRHLLLRLWLLSGSAISGCDGCGSPTAETASSSEPNTASPVAPPAPPPPESEMAMEAGYRVDRGRDCDGFATTDLQTPSPLCVGLVTSKESESIAATGVRFRPRTIAQHPTDDNVFYITDAGARRDNAGSIWRLTLQNGAVQMTKVVGRLNRPHGSELGPDGRLYFGELGRIFRLTEDGTETVIDGIPSMLPSGERIRFHPLTAFVFAANGDLLLNVGSGTDHCAESLSGAPTETRCHDEREHTAAIWRYRYLGEGRFDSHPAFVAHGLRNSVALSVHASGTILQGENGTDFDEEGRPHEELNIVQSGRHYGWPYCYDRDTPDPRWSHAGFVCSPSRNAEYQPPHLLLPPHSAPLSMLYYPAAGLSGLTGRLLISFHGYRAAGHRIVAFEVDERGIPAPESSFNEVVSGWDAAPTHPRGAPVGMTVARDGSLWFVEDTNGTVMRLSRDQYRDVRNQVTEVAAEAIVADPEFIALHRDIFAPVCGVCHAALNTTDDQALQSMVTEGWLSIEDGQETRLWSRIIPGAERPMPPSEPLSDQQRQRIRRWLLTRARPN